MSKDNLRKKIKASAITALVSEKDNNSSAFVKEAYDKVFGSGYLTERWVESINNWGDQYYLASRIDEEGNIPIGLTFKVESLKIVKKTARNRSRNRHGRLRGKSHYDYIVENDAGWRYWFRIYMSYKWTGTGLVPEFTYPKKGDRISFTAHVKDNKTGITFLYSPTSWTID